MSDDMITYELDGNVALIGLNRPDKRNAMNDTVIGLLREAVVRAGDEADCGVIFGHGKNFSAGLDLGAERVEVLARPARHGEGPPADRRDEAADQAELLVARFVDGAVHQ